MTVTIVENSDLEKNSSQHVDNVSLSDKDMKTEAPIASGDYSGAAAKTDPAEIALVRKLDYRVMPALFCLYFL